MNEQDNPQPSTGQTDLAKTEDLRSRAEALRSRGKPPPPVKHDQKYAVAISAESPEVISQMHEPQGILMRFRSNKISRDAALKALQASHEGRLTVLQHGITETVKMRKIEIDNRVGEYLTTLDAEHLKVLAELGLRNVDIRLAACKRLGDLVDAAVKEATATDWLDEMKQKAIDGAFALYHREHAKIMEELGHRTNG